jgi:pyruvate/2-oxoglutarate dehydrogenase complex dihydrolipoamide acyltransferase (E2) component
MKDFIVRLSLAAGLILGVLVLGGSANAQEPSSQDPAATAPPQQSPSSTQQPTPAETPQEPTARPQQEPNEPAANPHQNEPQMPAAGHDATKDAQAFTGRIVKENGKVVLKDPVTKTSYQIDDASKAKQFMGKQVKVTGKLDMNTNTIHVDSIEPMS